MRTAVVVDDHPFIRSSIKMLLQQAGCEVVAEAGNGGDALRLVSEHNPYLIVLDIAMPGMDGLRVLRHIAERGLASKVLILTSYPAEVFSVRCMKAGAAGFISKCQPASDLLDAFKVVSSGYTCFPQVATSMVDRKSNEAEEIDRIKTLSNRELNVLIQIANGLSNKAIGQGLNLSGKTVSAYKTRIIEKLGISSVVHLAELVKRNGLI